MREHVAAVVALLEATGRKVYVGEVEDAPTYPYYLVWTSPGSERTESLQADDDFLDDSIRVTSVGMTTESVFSLTNVARNALRRVAPAVTGWHTEPLRLDPNPPPITVDYDVVIPGTKRHAQYGVDEYLVVAERIA